MRFLQKLRALLWSRRTYALCYAVGVWLLHTELGFTQDQAAEIVVAVLSWVFSDSIKPTGGVAPDGPPLRLPTLAESVRFWALVASHLVTLTLPETVSAPVVAALSTLILGRAMRRPA